MEKRLQKVLVMLEAAEMLEIIRQRCLDRKRPSNLL